MSSMKHAEATLEGCNGPFFPPEAEELHRQLDRAGSYDGAWLKEVGETIEEFQDISRPTTSDGYDWFWSLDFSIGKGKILVLIPWAQDWDKTDGTQRDRGIAVHTKGVDEVTAAQVVQKLVSAVKNRRE